MNEQENRFPYFNISHPSEGGIIVVLARRGASIRDILIPFERDGQRQYRSVVLKANNENNFGSVRFGFDDEVNSWNLTNQLPMDYPYLDAYRQDWSMFVDLKNPHRARFVDGFVEIIYEFSSTNRNEFSMKTTVSPPANQQLLADPTNNVYFNLRGEGNLSTVKRKEKLLLLLDRANRRKWNLNSSSWFVFSIISIWVRRRRSIWKLRKSSTSTDLFKFIVLIKSMTFETSSRNLIDLALEKITSERKRSEFSLSHSHSHGVMFSIVLSLSETTTKTTLDIFSDQAGLIVDPNGVLTSDGSDLHGIRISPRQTPSSQQRVSFSWQREEFCWHFSLVMSSLICVFQSVYGQSLVIYPSQSIHTTWWQFNF